MKKLTLALLMVILLAILGYWYFSTSIPKTSAVSSWESFVPEEVTSMLQVNTLKLRDLIINESIKSPKKMKDLYDNLDSLKVKIELPTKEVEYLIKNGLNIPDQLIAFEYSLNEHSIISAIFPIKSKKKLIDQLTQREYINISDNQYYLQKEKLGLLIEDELCIFFHSEKFNQESFGSAANYLVALSENKVESKNEVAWPDVSLKVNEQSPLISNFGALPASSITITGNHLIGESVIEILLEKKDSTTASFFSPSLSFANDDESIAHLSLGLNISDYPLSTFLGEKQIKDINKSLASLQGSVSDIDKIWEGQLDFSLKEPKEIKEKFVTYEYDDNFEKVEKIEWKKTTNPDFDLFFSLKEKGTESLKSKSWVTDKEFVAYPFQKVYFESKNDVAYLSSSKSSAENFSKANNEEHTRHSINSSSAISLSIDIKEITKYYPQLFKKEDLSKYQQYVESISITDSLTPHTEALRLNFSYTNKNQNGLISLIELLKKTPEKSDSSLTTK